MLSISVCIASGAHNGYYVKCRVMRTIITMRVIIRCTHTMILQKPCHYVNGQSYQSRKQPRYLRIIIRMRSIPISSAWQHSCRSGQNRGRTDPFRYFWLTLQVCVGKANPFGGAGGLHGRFHTRWNSYRARVDVSEKLRVNKKLRGAWSTLQARCVLWDETLFRWWYLWMWYLQESQMWRDSRRGRGSTDRENMRM